MPAAALTRTDDSALTNLEAADRLKHGARLIGLVRHILGENGIVRPFSTTDQLSTVGLSSLDMVRLMLAIEAEFSITIPAGEITPSNFHSIATIDTLVARISSSPAA